MPAPTPPLLGLGSFYIPSPDPSPDDILDQKPLDLSSKSPQPETPLSWLSSEAREKETLLNSVAKMSATFQKPVSPISNSGEEGGVLGFSRTFTGSSILKQLSSGRRSVFEAAGLGSPGPLSNEDLIARVLEAKTSGR